MATPDVLDLDVLVEQLGPNRVHLKIEEDARFAQGPHRVEASPSLIFDRMPNPFTMYESIRAPGKSKISTPMDVSMRGTVRAAALEKLNTKPENTHAPASTPTPIKASARDEPIVQSSCKIQGNTFFQHVLSIIDPLTTVMSEDLLSNSISKFKQELAKNLGNEKQLFKVFGFSKKKSLSLDTMQANITQTVTDRELLPEVLLYIAKLLKMNLVVCTLDSPHGVERLDVDGCDAFGTPCRLFTWDSVERGYHMHTVNDKKSAIRTMFVSQLLASTDFSKTKVPELKVLYKFFSGEAKAPVTKAELISFLERVKTEP